MANSKEPQLSFKPITEGLGFHPFSDGLPYAPTVKTPTTPQRPQGTGAVAAGRPAFVPPKPLAISPHSSLPTTRPAAVTPAHSGGLNAGRVSVPVAMPSTLMRPTAAPASPRMETKPVPGLQTRYGFIYLFKRILAYLLDCALNLALCSAIVSSVLWRQDFDPEALMSPAVLVMGILFLLFCNWAITAAQEVAFNTSIGKRIFGLTLHGTGMQTFIRAVFFIPSVSFAGLGLIWAIFDSNKRCWHDKAADLQPDEIARL